MIKMNKKKFIILYSLVMILVFLLVILKTPMISSTNPIHPSYLRTSDHMDVKPFIIDENGEGNFTWAEAVLQPWCSGSGTEGDPYIIEWIYINGLDSTSCIEIWNSMAHVRIYYCNIHNAGYSGDMVYAGIKLNNTNNIQLIHNQLYSNNGHALVLCNSNSTIISDNLIVNNGENVTSYHNAKLFYNSHNTFITENEANGNAYDAFDITHCENTTIINNEIHTSGHYGAILYSCKNFNIINNEMRGNWLGIGLEDSNHNNISKNFIDSLDVGITCEDSTNNTIHDNTLRRSSIPEFQFIDSIAIWLLSSNNNNIQRNDINDQFEAGIFCHRSNYNIIVKNRISQATIYGIGLSESNYNNVSRNVLTNNEVCIEEISCVENAIENNKCRKGVIPGYRMPLFISFAFLGVIIIIIIIRRRT